MKAIKTMKTIALCLLVVLPLVSCGTEDMNSNTDIPVDSGRTTVAEEEFEGIVDLSETGDSAEKTDYSFEGTVFYYGEQTYDVTSRVEAINCIIDAVSVGEKIIVECHVGPKNAVYCIFDTNSQAFENDLVGCNLIWHDNDIKTAVYSYWSDIYKYDGSIIKSYDFAEDEYISNLAFSDDKTKLIVTISTYDGGERSDTIELYNLLCMVN